MKNICILFYINSGVCTQTFCFLKIGIVLENVASSTDALWVVLFFVMKTKTMTHQDSCRVNANSVNCLFLLLFSLLTNYIT